VFSYRPKFAWKRFCFIVFFDVSGAKFCPKVIKNYDVPRFKLVLIRSSTLYIMASVSNNNYKKSIAEWLQNTIANTHFRNVYIRLAPYTLHLFEFRVVGQNIAANTGVKLEI